MSRPRLDGVVWIGKYWLPPIYGGESQAAVERAEVELFNKGYAHWANKRECSEAHNVLGGCKDCILCSNFGDKNQKEQAYAQYMLLKGYKITRKGIAESMPNLATSVEKVED